MGSLLVGALSTMILTLVQALTLKKVFSIVTPVLFRFQRQDS